MSDSQNFQTNWICYTEEFLSIIIQKTFQQLNNSDEFLRDRGWNQISALLDGLFWTSEPGYGNQINSHLRDFLRGNFPNLISISISFSFQFCPYLLSSVQYLYLEIQRGPNIIVGTRRAKSLKRPRTWSVWLVKSKLINVMTRGNWMSWNLS